MGCGCRRNRKKTVRQKKRAAAREVAKINVSNKKSAEKRKQIIDNLEKAQERKNDSRI